MPDIGRDMVAMKKLGIILARRLLLAWALALSLPVNAVSSSEVPDSAFFSRFPYICFVDEVPDSLSDEMFLDIAAKVVFPVNKYALPKGDALLGELEREVIPLLNQGDVELLRIMFRGAASPEGPFSNNRMLARRRARALYEFFTERVKRPLADSLLTTDIDIEDYRTLCLMMRRANDADYDLVKRLCDRHLPRREFTLLKTRLQQEQQGKLWRRLLHDYFPPLRAARIILFLRKMPAPASSVREKEAGLPVSSAVEGTVSSVTETDTTQTAVLTEPVEDLTETNVEVNVEEALRIPRREVLSVKSNLLFDFAYMPGYNRWCPIPNVAIEFYPLYGHFTVAASFDMPWWGNYWKHKYFQFRNYQFEGRYYFRSGDIRKNPPGEGAAFRGLYLSAYAHTAIFGICFNENHGWVGEGGGAGAGVGYVLPLGRKGHWRMEFALQAGFFRCKYDPYKFENPVNPAYRDHLYYYKWTGKPEMFKERQYRFSWFGPTRIGITLSYDLLYWRYAKRGVGFRSTERRATL